ncbi:hypothetical protein CsatA_004310 [Cannabis sativa]
MLSILAYSFFSLISGSRLRVQLFYRVYLNKNLTLEGCFPGLLLPFNFSFFLCEIFCSCLLFWVLYEFLGLCFHSRLRPQMFYQVYLNKNLTLEGSCLGLVFPFNFSFCLCKIFRSFLLFGVFNEFSGLFFRSRIF